MSLVRVGSLPVSAVNIGLAASIGGLTAKVAKLQADLTKLTPALAGQIEIGLDFPPSPTMYAGPLALALNPLELAAVFNPANMTAASADLSVDLAADLVFVTAQLEIVEALAATFTAGLDAGGVAGWSYSGNARGFGSELERYTATGFGRTAADAQIQAVVIATESLAGWQAFSQGVNTNGTANAPASALAARLAFLGELSGRRWNTGVASLAGALDLLVADFRGQKAGLEASAQVALGLNLPDVGAVVDAGLSIVADVGIDGLLENLFTVQADITGAIGDVTAQVDAVLALAADIAAQLSAGGLTFWTYAGTASGLGEALKAELAGGIPSGSGAQAPAYGLALAGTPASMALFGSIFKTS
jgi:hypothetical protein